MPMRRLVRLHEWASTQARSRELDSRLARGVEPRLGRFPVLHQQQRVSREAGATLLRAVRKRAVEQGPLAAGSQMEAYPDSAEELPVEG